MDDFGDFPDLPEEKESEYDELDIFIFFNKLQSPWQHLFIDMSDADNFNECHPRYTINIPIGTSKKDIISTLKQDIEAQQNIIANVYIYTTNNNDESQEHYCVITNILKEEFTMFPTIYIFNDKDSIFEKKYPFLCIKEQNNNSNEEKKDADQKANKYRQLFDMKSFMQLYCARIGYHLEYPDQILNDRLFLGDYNAATRKNILQNLGITHIVNCTKEDNEFEKDKDMNIKYFKIHVNDVYYELIAMYFDKAIEFMDNAMKENENNKIFVHCAAGVSRSSTIVIVYLMKCHCMSMDVAFNYVQERRSCIDPNEGFRVQLKHYQQNGYMIDTKSLTKQLQHLYK